MLLEFSFCYSVRYKDQAKSSQFLWLDLYAEKHQKVNVHMIQNISDHLVQ